MQAMVLALKRGVGQRGATNKWFAAMIGIGPVQADERGAVVTGMKEATQQVPTGAPWAAALG